MKKAFPLSLPILLLASLAGAATLQILNLDEMTAQSSAVVQARVTGSRTEWNDANKKNFVVTKYTLQSDHYIKGNLGSTFELVEPGGRLGDRITSIPGAPVFREGDELVLFVWTHPTTGTHQSMGFDQGAFRITRDASGAKVLDHSQPLSGGGQIVESGTVPASFGPGRTSHDLNTFLVQVGTSVRRVAASAVVKGGK
jgi:hypothetical protein